MSKGLTPEELQPSPAGAPRATPGTLRKDGINLFRCSVCQNEHRTDQEYEPLCTGPHPLLDEHRATVMKFVAVVAPKLII